MPPRYSVPLLLFVQCIVAAVAMAQPAGLETYGLFELPLFSTRTYAHPHRDVRIWCEFTSPSGKTFKHEGYWNGNKDYRVRFAPPEAGRWRYGTSCSDTTNKGLQGITGEFVVKPYSGDDPFRKKGWLKMSDNKRYLTYDNGDPFFYLGDTAWEIVWKSRLEQMKEYIADRRSKEFTAVQIVTMSHQVFDSFGVRNRYGEPYLLNNDRSMLNPRYFDYLDSIVTTANANGMVAVLTPLWAAMMYAHADLNRYRFLFSREETELLARYIGARYGGYNVIWIIGGDAPYDTPEKRAAWEEFAHTLRSASGNHHLATTHPNGWRSSFDFYPQGADWLDFHMYQSSHTVEGNFTFDAALRGWQLDPPLPVLNGEACYEDIYNNLWLPGDTAHPNTFRIPPVDVRRVSYESILSGAQVGMTYGANGVWQWNTPELPGSHRPRLEVEDAWNMPGSSQMTVLKRLLEKYQWYKYQPRRDIPVVRLYGKEDYLPICGDSTRLLMYLPANTDSLILYIGGLGYNAFIQWINPATGDIHHTEKASSESEPLGAHWFLPPDTNDWFVVVSRQDFNFKATKLQVYGLLDVPLQSTLQYAHPHKDVRLWGEFTAPDGGRVFRHEGFWDGGNIYRVRFAPPDTGVWKFRTICSDTTNPGLHNISGEFRVDPYTGDNPFRKKGWLKVSDNKRYLTYDNGDPFFYLGDTAWEIVRKAVLSEVRHYIADRKRKGFNAIQIVTASHIYLPLKGVLNAYGETVYLDTNYSLINPRYFDFMDSIVAIANDSEMVVAIVPIWGALNERFSSNGFHRKSIPDAETLLMERYVAARLGGYNVIWIVSADEHYDTQVKREIWNQAAYLLDSAGGGMHLCTIHPGGWSSSIDYFPDTDWLDFHMFQSSHSVRDDYTWYGGNQGYKVQPTKPTLNGECNYEDIYNKLIDHYIPDINPEVFRIGAEHIRQACYESLLSGALVGMTYGANGIWQWSKPGNMDIQWPRYAWDAALAFPGSTQMGVLRTLMERYHWYNLMPGQNLITRSISGRENYLPVAYDTGRILVYFPMHTESAGVNFQILGKGMRLEWINPVTGGIDSVREIINREGLGACNIAPPDTNDWLLVAIRIAVPDSVAENSPDTTHHPVEPLCTFHIENPTPNPCMGVTTIRYSLPDAGIISLTWYDVWGRRAGMYEMNVKNGTGEWRVEDLAPGFYQLRLIYTPNEGKREEWQGRIVSMQ